MSGPTIELLLIQAKRLLEEARVAAESGRALITYDLTCLALQVIGAALDRCAGVAAIRGELS